MQQFLIEVDDTLAGQIDKVAPAKSRKRSEFIRTAIRRALWEIQEQETRAAYARIPDTAPAPFDAETWEPAPKVSVKSRRRKR